jgi:hypothetical protein
MSQSKRSSQRAKTDKPFMKRPMRDVLSPVFDDGAVSGDEVNDTVDVFNFDEDFNNKLIRYNEIVSELDPDFTSLKPFNKVLVRVHVNPLKRNAAGLLIPSEQIVTIPTKAGYGNIAALRNPWPFGRIATIIATPVFMKEEMTPGDEVILSGTIVEGKMLGSVDQGYINLPFQFLHPEFVEGNAMPIDPEDKAYGYMLIPAQAIEVKL